MRNDILRLVETFPSVAFSRVDRFFPGARPYVDALVRDGLICTDTATRRGRPAEVLRSTRSVGDVIHLDPELADENKAARAQVALWIGRIALIRDGRGTDAAKRRAQAALDMMVALFRSPHKYGRETPLADVVVAAGGDPEQRLWMRAARLLQTHGVVDLFERKGVGRVTTLQIKNPPPYPMGPEPNR